MEHDVNALCREEKRTVHIYRDTLSRFQGWAMCSDVLGADYYCSDGDLLWALWELALKAYAERRHQC